MSSCKLLLKEVAVKEGEKGQDLEQSNNTTEFGETREEALGIPIVNILCSWNRKIKSDCILVERESRIASFLEDLKTIGDDRGRGPDEESVILIELDRI